VSNSTLDAYSKGYLLEPSLRSGTAGKHTLNAPACRGVSKTPTVGGSPQEMQQDMQQHVGALTDGKSQAASTLAAPGYRSQPANVIQTCSAWSAVGTPLSICLMVYTGAR